MSKFTDILEKKIIPLAGRIGSQPHLQAVRSGIIATLPLTIVGSFFVIFLNIPLEGYAALIAPIRAVIDIPFRFTVGMLALFSSFSIAASLAERYKLDKVTSGFLGLLSFLLTAIDPIIITQSIEGVITSGRYVNLASFSASSLFSAILCALLSVEIYRFMIERNITIKMPKGVPSGVVNSFGAIFPVLVIIVLFWGVRHWLKIDINTILTNILMPLKNFFVGNSLLGGLITVVLICLFWVLGIHGPAILGPVIRPMWDLAIADNMEAFALSGNAYELPYIFTEQFLQWFVWIGGAGITLPLVFLFLFSRSKYLKQLGRITLIPGLFNINEPVIFGAPIVMNPILAIPFILAPLAVAIISYLATVSGVIPLMMARLPFTLPAPVAAIISTNWNVGAGILVFVNFFVALIIYLPFFKKFEQQALAAEQAAEK